MGQDKGNSIRGFTLIELSIVMVIIGVMVGATAQALDVWYNRHALDQQTERMTTIHTAIASYLSSTGHLPCPARYDLPQSDPNFGVGGGSVGAHCTGLDPAPPLRVAGARVGFGSVRIGAVPVRDLGLSNTYSADPWGYRFTYAVTEALATTAGYDPAKGAIDVIDNTLPTPATVLPGGIAGTALYALVDHGRDGAGAYTGDAGVLHTACPASGPETENCDGLNATFRTIPVSTGSIYFDDIAQYRTSITASVTGTLPAPPPCTGASALQWTGSGWACNPAGGSAGKAPDHQIFVAPGGAWIAPSGFGASAVVYIRCWGAGGGGGSGGGGAGGPVGGSGGGGGGSGAYGEKQVLLSSLPSPVTVTITSGTGGAKNCNGCPGLNGTDGVTSFGATLTGLGGVHGGFGRTNNAAPGTGGAGGSAAGATFAVPGTAGASGGANSGGTGGGGGSGANGAGDGSGGTSGSGGNGGDGATGNFTNAGNAGGNGGAGSCSVTTIDASS